MLPTQLNENFLNLQTSQKVRITVQWHIKKDFCPKGLLLSELGIAYHREPRQEGRSIYANLVGIYKLHKDLVTVLVYCHLTNQDANYPIHIKMFENVPEARVQPLLICRPIFLGRRHALYGSRDTGIKKHRITVCITLHGRRL